MVAPAAHLFESAAFDPFSADARPTEAVAVTESEPELSVDPDDLSAVAAPGTKVSKGKSARGRTTPSGRILPTLRVSRAVVLKWAQAGTRPTGRPVSAAGQRPAGIQVFGASALGIGVRDGDVLTLVNGVPVTSVGQVVGLVIAARGARQPQISGQLWRGQRHYTLVVEQPYLQPNAEGPSAPAAPTKPEPSVHEGASPNQPVARLNP